MIYSILLINSSANKGITMRDILEKYLNTHIGINFEKPFHISSAKLLNLNEHYFSIIDDKDYTHHYSYRSIVQITEHPDGVEIGGLFTHSVKHPVVVKVGHLVEYVPA